MCLAGAKKQRQTNIMTLEKQFLGETAKLKQKHETSQL